MAIKGKTTKKQYVNLKRILIALKGKKKKDGIKYQICQITNKQSEDFYRFDDCLQFVRGYIKETCLFNLEGEKIEISDLKYVALLLPEDYDVEDLAEDLEEFKKICEEDEDLHYHLNKFTPKGW